MDKLEYWYKKIPELKKNIEPLTLLMIRLSGEIHHYYLNNKKSKKTKVINTKDILLLHTIDRKPALNKFLDRRNFLLKNKKKINELIKKEGSLDLRNKIFDNSPFKSINNELVAEINYSNNKIKYITCSGVGRIAAIQSVFKEGINITIDVLNIHYDLQKKMIAVHSLFIYNNRFDHLKKYNIKQEEIIFDKKKNKTYKKYNRKPFLKIQKKRTLNKIIPIAGEVKKLTNK